MSRYHVCLIFSCFFFRLNCCFNYNYWWKISIEKLISFFEFVTSLSSLLAYSDKWNRRTKLISLKSRCFFYVLLGWNRTKHCIISIACGFSSQQRIRFRLQHWRFNLITDFNEPIEETVRRKKRETFLFLYVHYNLVAWMQFQQQ